MLAAASGYGAYADSAAGQPQTYSVTLCGVGKLGADVMEGSSNQDHPAPTTYSATELQGQVECNGDNSMMGSDDWTISHSNVDVVTERGTEHGIWQRPSAPPTGFNGHITDYDPAASDCSSGSRDIFYQSGKATYCSPSTAPVGNFNTHGGAQLGEHAWGNYGTIVFQDSSTSANNHCPTGGATYCIQVHLAGQSN